jgi:ATP-binding cassette, subfamily B, bacterial PglK
MKKRQKKEAPLFSVLRELFSRREKKIILILLVASVFVSIIETASLSAVMVFVAVATNFSLVHSNYYYSMMYKICGRFLGISTPASFVILLGVGLLFFYGFRMLLNVAHIYAMNYFAQMRQHSFSQQLFKTYLRFNYKDFVTKNGSEISQAIMGYTGNITQITTGLLAIAAEGLTIFCVYAMLFCVNLKMTIVLTFLLALKITIIIKAFSKKITGAGRKSQAFSIKKSKVYSESFGNFKYLKLISYEKPIANRFHSASLGLSEANTVNAVWQSLPRFVLETIGFFILVGVIVYVIFRYNDATFVVPVVSMYALAFYRFLPSVNKILMGYNQIIFSQSAVQPLYEFLHHKFEHLGSEPVVFKKSIELKNVSFAYKHGKDVLEYASIKISKGERVGFIGESGAGKSTIVDVLMGLYIPEHGKICVDGKPLCWENVKAWRQKIGYIPQAIHLFDGTIAENVACGRPYDEAKIIEVLSKAHIYDFLLTKDGIHSRAGEFGVMLSGGQKQRIAIARALYSDPEVLVLDEATSALDNQTEGKIMDEVYKISQNVTLIVVAHRLTTIERCDVIYRVEGRRVKFVKSLYGDESQRGREKEVCSVAD